MQAVHELALHSHDAAHSARVFNIDDDRRPGGYSLLGINGAERGAGGYFNMPHGSIVYG